MSLFLILVSCDCNDQYISLLYSPFQCPGKVGSFLSSVDADRYSWSFPISSPNLLPPPATGLGLQRQDTAHLHGNCLPLESLMLH